MSLSLSESEVSHVKFHIIPYLDVKFSGHQVLFVEAQTR